MYDGMFCLSAPIWVKLKFQKEILISFWKKKNSNL